ncbi:MAG TPA: hypothetical protein VGN72_17585 [Tepidisphaeraceae bacterium]|nr:hypothetical protein [Tepidisphaeraceae bacterium]
MASGSITTDNSIPRLAARSERALRCGLDPHDDQALRGKRELHLFARAKLHGLLVGTRPFTEMV